MKWYKKQMDALKKKNAIPAVEQPSELKKKKPTKNAFPNPVKQRNQNRPKTDAIS